MIAPARTAAYEALSAISRGRLDLPSAVADARFTLTDDRDRALVSELVTGVQRWRGRLDFLIADAAKRELRRLDPEVLEILRLGAFQLLHLSRVPAAAVVDDAVKMTGKAGKRSAAGLVNAVLRTISRSRNALPLPARPANEAERTQALDYLSVTLSHPRWLAERWLDRLGFARAEAWMTFNNQPAPLTLRVNLLRTGVGELERELAARDIVVHRARYAPEALIVDDGRPLQDPGAESEWFVVQDEASQLVAMLAGEAPTTPLLDTCASPGGKTTSMASAAEGRGPIVACDVRERRIDLLERTVRAAGAEQVRIVQADLLAGLPFRDVFGCVVVDAPCSGLGTLRRDPDIKWRRSAADLEVLAEAQRRMLREAAAAVAPGGRLVYSTCSTEPEENEQIVEDFLAGHPAFRPVPVARINGRLDADVFDEQGALRTQPDRHDLEGFFGVVLERTAGL